MRRVRAIGVGWLDVDFVEKNHETTKMARV